MNALVMAVPTSQLKVSVHHRSHALVARLVGANLISTDFTLILTEKLQTGLFPPNTEPSVYNVTSSLLVFTSISWWTFNSANKFTTFSNSLSIVMLT